MTSDAKAVSLGSCVDAKARVPLLGLARCPLKGRRSPLPSEGQRSFQLQIEEWLGLLGLTLHEQIIE
jgi:hypothetical protein